MDNVAPIEIAWMSWGLIGWMAAAMVLGGAITLLIGRYQDARNGAVRLLAWQFVVVSFLCWLGLTAILVIGSLALMLPPRLNDLSSPWERSVAAAAGWLSPAMLFLMATAFVGIAIAKIVIQFRLYGYYQADEATRRERGPR